MHGYNIEKASLLIPILFWVGIFAWIYIVLCILTTSSVKQIDSPTREFENEIVTVQDYSSEYIAFNLYEKIVTEIKKEGKIDIKRFYKQCNEVMADKALENAWPRVNLIFLY